MKAISKTASALPVSAALQIDLRAKARMADGMDVISFCVGEPDFSPPPEAALAGIRAIESGQVRYTNASGTPELRAAAAFALKRDQGLAYDPSQVVITAGGKYAVYAAVMAIADPGDEILLPAPYWTSYIHILRLAGAVPVILPCARENGWKLTPEQLNGACTQKTKALILNHPNNPTGAVYSHEELSGLAALCRERDLYVISDEIYSRLIYTPEPFCAPAAVNADMYRRTVTINGVSKAYAMTGWRIGYAAGDPEIMRAISAILSHTTGSPNAIAQAAAKEALLGSQEDTRRMKQAFERRRDLLVRELESLPDAAFTVPQGAFYVLMDIRALIQRGAYADDTDFALRLLDSEGVATVPCADYGAPGCIRLSYTLADARIAEGIGRMKRFIERTQ